MKKIDKTKDELFGELNALKQENVTLKTMFETDIDERKKAEESMQESEERFRSLYENSTIGLYRTNPDGKIILANPTLVKLLGYSSFEELAARNLEKDGFESTYERKQFLEQIETNGEVNGFESAWNRKDGLVIYVRESARAYHDSNGKALYYDGTVEDITERKQAEKKILLDKIFAEQLINSLPGLFYQINTEGKFVRWNKNLETLSGYSHEEMAEISPLELFTGEDKLNIEKNIIRVFSEGNASIEASIISKNQTKIPYYFTGKKIIIDDQIYLAGLGIDISTQKANEKIIKESEVHFRSFFENSPVGFFVFDLSSFKFVSVNAAAEKLFKFTKEELQNKNPSDISSEFQPDGIKSEKKIREAIAKTLAGEKSNFEWVYHTSDGNEILTQTTLTLLPSVDSPLILASVLNITEKRKAEDNLKESEARFRELFETAPEALAVFDASTLNFAKCNNNAVKLIKFSPEEILKIGPINISPEFQPDGRASVDKAMEITVNALEGGTPVVEWLIIDANRKEILTELRLVSLSTISSPQILASFIDITERKKSEEKIEQQNKDLAFQIEEKAKRADELIIANKELLFQNEEKEKRAAELIIAKEKAEEMSLLKSNFLANMSHELRTPLIGINGFADFLRKDIENPELKEMADIIFQSGNRLSETLNLILDLSKFESENMDFTYQQIDLVSETEMTKSSFKEAARKKGLYLKSSFNQPSIYINTDPRAFNSILNNLINNAIKYTNEGGITVDLSLKDNFVEIKVIDSGMGIAKENHEIIFDEFRQVSEGYSRNFEGTGLGLNITMKLVKKIGGEISVESELGKGSTFIVKLPVKVAEEKIADKTIIGKAPLKVITRQKSVKHLALVVDDDPNVFPILKRYTGGQIELESTHDGEFAVKLCGQKQYDYIFMDINLRRGMDGEQATQAIRKIKGYESIPIIATTAYAMVGDKEEFLAAGCSHYLSKPFSQEQISNLLEEIVA